MTGVCYRLKCKAVRRISHIVTLSIGTKLEEMLSIGTQSTPSVSELEYDILVRKERTRSTTKCVYIVDLVTKSVVMSNGR